MTGGDELEKMGTRKGDADRGHGVEAGGLVISMDCS